MSFIVLEGIDGSGKATQAELLKKWGEERGNSCVVIKSPNFTTPVGQAYRKYLYNEFQMDNEAIFLLCACDVIINKPIIERVREGGVLIADRYITSTIAYQAANNFPFEKALGLVDLLEFPKADAIIFIDITPETSVDRKNKEKGVLDRHEKDKIYLAKVREFYLKEVERNVLGEWFVVDGEGSIDEVHDSILQVLEKEVV